MHTSCPRAASPRESSTTCFWAPWKARSLITSKSRMRRTLLEDRFFGSGGHPALAPQLEGHEVPELLDVEALVVGAAVAEIAHGRGHHVRIEDAGLADALRVQVLVHQGRELAAHPRRQRHGE